MLKKWILIVFVFILLGISATIITFLYLTKQNEKKYSPQSSKNTLPDELTYKFDPTVNAPIFKIISVNENVNLLDLNLIFPENANPKQVTSLISCTDGDIKIVNKGIKTNSDIITLFEEIKKGLMGIITISGICKDLTCQEIYKNCILNLHNNR